MPLIDLGLVDGNYWNASHVDALEKAINDGQPAGMVIMTVAAAAPTGWLLLNGQVVPNAQTLYPSLWAAIPSSFKSGSTMTLPNMASRFPIGQSGTIAAVGGTNSHTIAAGELPAHSHPVNIKSGDQIGGSDGGSGAHNHAPNGGGSFVSSLPGTGGGFVPLAAGTNSAYVANNATSPDFGVHAHQLTGNTDPVGSGTAIDTTPAYLTFNFLIRAY